MLERARAAEVHRMLVAGIDGRTSKRAVELANKNECIYASVGVHPHDASTCSESLIREFAQLASHPKVVAWGEVGLDFNRMYSPQKDQERWLIRQLEMADMLDLPGKGFLLFLGDPATAFLQLLRQPMFVGRSGTCVGGP